MYNLEKKHEYFIGIDSDGCVFDTMEIKHKECFTPCTVLHWNLQAVSKYTREACEFVNLYSQSRGVNRFLALIEELEWLADRPEVAARGLDVQVPESLREWVKNEKRLGNPALAEAVARTQDPVLIQTLKWSEAVNKMIEEMVFGIPPFPYVRESLEAMRGRADVLCVSQTPSEALNREWEEHDLRKYVVEICGQEFGSKKEVMQNAAKYAPNYALMIGDAPGDYQAASANHALFFPINPGAEEASWERFYKEGLEKFFAGTFAGEYQEALLEEFHTYLPSEPPWKR